MLRTFSILAAAGLAAALLVGVGSAAEPAPPADASGAAAIERAIDGVEAFYSDVTSFRGRFEQEVRRAHLPRALKRSGRVYYKSPGKMRWDYTEPDTVYYISDGEVLWSYEAETRQVIKMGVRDSDLYDSLRFLFGQGDLRGSFVISAAPSAGGTVGLQLVPRAGQSNYKSLTLHADPKTWEIRRSELVDPLDNVSVITFSEVTYESIEDKVFAFTPPRGTVVQDMTRGAEPPAGTRPDR